jgi:hypothetical protein
MLHNSLGDNDCKVSNILAVMNGMGVFPSIFNQRNYVILMSELSMLQKNLCCYFIFLIFRILMTDLLIAWRLFVAFNICWHENYLIILSMILLTNNLTIY